MLSLLISFNHELVHLSSKKILIKSSALLNVVIASPESLSGVYLACFSYPIHGETTYHIDPCWLYVSFLTHTSAKGTLAPNTCYKMIVQKKKVVARARKEKTKNV